MSLDPVRADRVRRMVLDKSTWPLNHLPMKRIKNGQIVEFGTISDLKPNLIQVTVNNLDSPVKDFRAYAYGNVDALIADGWTVD